MELLAEFFFKYWWIVLGSVIWPVFWNSLTSTFAKRADLSETNKRITTIETTVAQLPTARDLANLQLKVETLQGSINTILHSITNITKTTDTLLEIELKREKGNKS